MPAQLSETKKTRHAVKRPDRLTHGGRVLPKKITVKCNETFKNSTNANHVF